MTINIKNIKHGEVNKKYEDSQTKKEFIDVNSIM